MCVIDNPYEFNEAQKLLKQMEVEQMNHISNDQIKKRVSVKEGRHCSAPHRTRHNAVNR